MRFAHKGLEALWRADDAHKLNAGHVPRIRRILSDLQSANAPQDMKLPIVISTDSGAPNGTCGAFACRAIGASPSVLTAMWPPE